MTNRSFQSQPRIDCQRTHVLPKLGGSTLILARDKEGIRVYLKSCVTSVSTSKVVFSKVHLYSSIISKICLMLHMLYRCNLAGSGEYLGDCLSLEFLKLTALFFFYLCTDMTTVLKAAVLSGRGENAILGTYFFFLSSKENV